MFPRNLKLIVMFPYLPLVHSMAGRISGLLLKSLRARRISYSAEAFNDNRRTHIVRQCECAKMCRKSQTHLHYVNYGDVPRILGVSLHKQMDVQA
jgi:hypothetical protein